MGKGQNKSPPNSTTPVEDPNNEISLKGNQDTNLRRTIVDIFKDYKEQIKELKGDNEKTHERRKE